MEGGEEAGAGEEEVHAGAGAVAVYEVYRSAWRRMVSALTAASDFTMETEAGTSDAGARVQDASAGEIKVPDADGDDDAAKLEDALEEAVRRARDHAQSCLNDVPSYPIQLDITEESYDHLMTQLSKRMRDVCSLMIGEHPVTPPPVDGNDLFHIIKLCKGYDFVEMLFQESDLYFSGFRPKNSPNFYVFEDMVTPEWISSEILPYDSGYHATVANISLGPHCFPATFKHLFKFTPENFRIQTTDRQNALHWTMLNFSETRRIGSMNRKVKRLLRIGGIDTVGASIDDKVHGWGHKSCEVFAAATSDDVNWELIGCGGDLITFKFNKKHALPIIIARQKRTAEAAAAALNEITVLLKTHFSIDSKQACNWEQLHYYSQLPNFQIYLVFLLAHEKDVPSYPIQLDITEESYDHLMTQLSKRMRDVCSLMIGEHPVTPPPVDGNDLFHIIKLCKGYDFVEMLFQESDLYFSGFRPKNSPNFYVFEDMVTPEWISSEILPYDSGYHATVANISLGPHCFPATFKHLFKFTPENFKIQTTDRQNALHWTMLNFSETRRIGSMNRKVKRLLRIGGIDTVGASIDDKVHGWGHKSCEVFAAATSDDVNWELIGCGGDLITFKFNKKHALPIIIARQKRTAEAAAAALNEITVLLKTHFSIDSKQACNWEQLHYYSQLPNFQIYLVFLLAHEKDVPSYPIQLDITEESYDHLMTQLSKRMRDVCSLMIGEHPVTPPPVDGNDLFHIIKLCKGYDFVEMLFQESDLYFSGFRPKNSPNFYVFEDMVTSEWISSEILPYDSGYHATVANISLGPHCFPATFKHLFKFTPENFRIQTTDRQNALHWTMLNFSETRRIGSMNRKVKRLLRIGGIDTVGASIDDKVHGWGHKSCEVFAAATSDDVNWELIGCGGDLITFKFNKKHALPIIIARQKRTAEAAAATLNEITVLLKTHFSIDSKQACNWEQLHYYSQLPNFQIYLVFLLAHEKDVPSYPIQLDITEESYDHLMTQLSKRMRDVCSLMIGEHPVTPPPVDGNDLFHIIKLCKGYDFVEMLFQESDLYFSGFRPKNSPNFYVFEDMVTPEWISSEILPYDSGYHATVANISLGPHCFPATFKHLFKFTPENFRIQTTDRQNALHWTMLNFSETRRIGSMNRKVKRLLRIGGIDTVGASIDDKVHGWGHKSCEVFAAATSDDVNWELIGCGGDLITFKFNKKHALPIIIARQKRTAEAAAAALNEITVLLKTHFSIDSKQACNWEQLHYYSQLPNFQIYLVFLLAHEKDVPSYPIQLDITEESYDHLMTQLSKRMRDVCSLMIGEHPVTPPPVDGNDLFHIIKLCKGYDFVEMLFQESDLYFSGFRPKNSPNFYVFEDMVTPEWISSEILPYDSGYHATVANISLGPHCFPATFKHLFKFTPENFRIQTTDRQNALHWTMLNFSETRRIGSMNRKVKRLLRIGGIDTVGASIDDKVHGWGHKSCEVFAAATSDDVNWELIGCGGDLITFKFNKKHALPIIIARQKRTAEAAAAALNEITVLLKTHFSIDSKQACNWEQLHYYSQLPNFQIYLVFLLAHEKGISFELRQAAGLLLKNNLQLAFNAMPPSSQKYVKYELVTCIGSSHKQIRSTACTVISVLLQIVGFDKWVDLFETLRLCLDSQDLNQKEGAAETIYRICENLPEDSIVDAGLRDLLIYDFVPRLVKLFKTPHMSLIRLSLLCVNQCILVLPSEVFRNQFVEGLLELSKQTSTNVKKLVCSSWTLLMEHQLIPEPYLETAINFVLLANIELDEDLALEACKFWSYCDSSKGLQEVLPELIPTLVQKMVYTDHDDSLADIKEYESISIRDQDLKRRFHASRLHRFETGKENADDDDDDAVNAWNLRKYSTAGLNCLSKVLRDDILPILMPLIKDKLARTDDDEWKDREVAVLCINTIAEGCMTGLYSHTLQIFHVLIVLLDDKFPLVRRITCQTISRYSKFIVQSCDHEQFAEIIAGLLRRILDTNKKVQDAARSAFVTIGKDAAESNGMKIILEQLILEFRKHQTRDLWLISEALCSLADVVGAKLNKAEHLHIFVPPLIKKWQQLQKSNKDILPLLECFTSIAQAAGSGFFQFAEPVFQNCLDLIKFQQLANADPAAPHALDDKDFIVYPLDLLLGLAEALGADTESLVAQSDLIDIIMRCCKDEVAGVRQSALALLGGISMVCHTHVHPSLKEFLEVAAEQLIMQSVMDAPSVANNACLIIGELAMKFGQETPSPVVTTILSRLLPILRSSEGLDEIVVGNTAVTLGRLSLVWPMTVSAHLKRSMQAWCNALCMAIGDLGKEDGFSGLCEMVEANISRAVGSLAHVCRAFASLKDIQSEALPSKVRGALNNLKQSAGDACWEQCMSTLDPSEVQRLASLMAETEPQ